MKKYFLAIGLVAFLMTSCCDKQENKQNCEQNCKDKKEQCDKHQHECDKHQHECDHHGQMPEMCPDMIKAMDKIIECVAEWDKLSEEQQAEVVNMAKQMQEMKANMPKPECDKHEGKCDHKDGKKCDGNHEKCEHKK
ncbi:MAG: hypothetical protein IKS65_08945 [Bacteroidales bacterium]|nr:hypothetical protein [Bacteroidales bacterium]